MYGILNIERPGKASSKLSVSLNGNISSEQRRRRGCAARVSVNKARCDLTPHKRGKGIKKAELKRGGKSQFRPRISAVSPAAVRNKKAFLAPAENSFSRAVFAIFRVKERRDGCVRV